MAMSDGYASLLAAVAKGVTGDPGSAAGRATAAEFDRLAKEKYKRRALGYQRPLPEGDSIHRTRRTLDGRATSVDIAGGASTAADLAGEYVARQRLLTDIPHFSIRFWPPISPGQRFADQISCAWPDEAGSPRLDVRPPPSR